MDNVKYYASKKAQGKPLPYAREEDDPLQMGGDFTYRWVQMHRLFQNMGTLRMKIINVLTSRSFIINRYHLYACRNFNFLCLMYVSELQFRIHKVQQYCIIKHSSTYCIQRTAIGIKLLHSTNGLSQ